MGENKIPVENVVSSTADGDADNDGTEKWLFKINDDNSEILLVQIVNMVAKNISPAVNEMQKSVMICISAVESNAT